MSILVGACQPGSAAGQGAAGAVQPYRAQGRRQGHARARLCRKVGAPALLSRRRASQTLARQSAINRGVN